MTNVIITLRSSSLPTGTPLVIDLLDDELNRRWQGAALVNVALTLPEAFAPGRYGVIIGLPSGQSAQFTLKVGDERPTKFEVDLPASVRTGMAASSAQTVQLSRDEISDDLRSPLDVNLGKIWVRLWSRDSSGRWRVRRWTNDLQRASDGSVSGHFEDGELAAGLHYFQVGSGSSQPRITAVPSGRTSFLLRPSPRFDSDETAEFTVGIDIYAGGTEAQALIGYLSNGDLERAQVVGNDFLTAHLARDKFLDPTMAVLGAYYFLASRDLARLQQLVDRHFAHLSAWLPDAAVISAWQFLRQKSPDVAKARDHLVRAVRCGMPVYTRGLRLLHDGLRMMEADEELCNEAVRRAASLVRRFARVADWRPVYTTFYATRPSRPINPRHGIGWLIDAQRAAVDPYSRFPWAQTAEHAPRDKQAFQDEMRSAFSAPFSRAFAYPPGHQDVEAAKEAYQVLRDDMAKILEVAS